MSTDVVERSAEPAVAESSPRSAPPRAGRPGASASPAPAASRPGRSLGAGVLVRRASAVIVGLAGLACLAEVATSRVVPAGLFDTTDDLFWMAGVPTGPSVVVGTALLVLAPALRAGKRAGWWVLVTLLSLSTLAAALDVAAALAAWPAGSGVAGTGATALASVVLPLGWAAALRWQRRSFEARVPAGAWLQALVVAALGLGSAVVVGWALAAGSAAAGAPHGAWQRLVWVVDQLTGGTFALVPVDAGAAATGGWLPLALDLTGGAVLVTALALFLRSVGQSGTASADDELALRGLLSEHGGADSLAWFSTRRDKRVVFAPGGRAAVAHRVVAGSSVASGDPVGDPAAWSAAVEAWLAQTRRYGWQPVVLGAGEAGAAVYRRHGLRVRRIGDEAVVSTADLLREGGEDRRVLRAVRRLTAEGCTVVVRRLRDVPTAELADVEDRAAAWRSGAVERGFSMASGRTADPADLDVVLVEAFDGDGRPCGLLTFAPWGHDGLSLDVMRRAPWAPPGVVELMVGQLAAAAAPWGVRRLSMNFVVLREALESGARLGATPLERSRRTALRWASAVVQIESLHRSSLVWQPTWTPRLLCWSGSGVRAVAAAAAAEGFFELASVGGGRRTTAGLPRGSRFLAEVRGLDARTTGTPGAAATAARAATARQLGHDPYPAVSLTSDDLDDLGDVARRHRGLAAGASTGERVTVVGRVRSRRTLGSVSFAALRSGSAQLQVIVDKRTTGAEALTAWKAAAGVDDLVLVTGEVVASRTGELSVHAAGWQLLASSQRPVSGDPSVAAVRAALLDAGYAEASAPPRHPAEPGGVAPALDGAVEAIFHLEDTPSGAVLHVRESLRDAASMRHLLHRVKAALPEPDAHPEADTTTGAALAVFDELLPTAALPLARPRQDAPGTADAWSSRAGQLDVARACTGLTDPAVLLRLAAPGAARDALAQGLAPFAVMTVDLAALARVELPAPTALTATGEDVR